MLTDGEDNASKISLSEAISTAQHSDTLAYSIRIADEENGSFGPGGFGGFAGGRGGMGGGRGRGGLRLSVWMERRCCGKSRITPEARTTNIRRRGRSIRSTGRLKKS